MGIFLAKTAHRVGNISVVGLELQFARRAYSGGVVFAAGSGRIFLRGILPHSASMLRRCNDLLC
jgi:hypothetical protein